MIRSLHIRNFKSFRRVSLDLTELNILLGPNAAGKSNIAKSLNLFRDVVVTGDVGKAISMHGGPTEILSQGAPKTAPISFRVNVDLSGVPELDMPGLLYPEAWSPRWACYEIKFTTGISGKCRIVRENLTFRVKKKATGKQERAGEKELMVFSRNRNKVSFLSRQGRSDTNPFGGGKTLAGGVPDQAMPFVFMSRDRPDVQPFFDYVSRMRFYRIDVEKARQLGGLDDGGELRPDGSNLAQILARMKRGNGRQRRGFLEGFLDFMRCTIPEFDDYEVVESSGLGRVTISFRIKEKGGNAFSPFSVSDGTIRTLCFFLALAYHRPAASVICFEEPENDVHPYLLDALMSLVKNNFQTTQIILTTHNKSVADAVEPRNVFLISKENGKSIIVRGDSDRDILFFCKHYGVGEAWVRGLVGGVP
jgi:predicted ATPase